MAGHRPFPPDPTQNGAFDYDEETDAQGRHRKTKADRRKPFAIESRFVPTVPNYSNSLIGIFGLDQWFIHRRYEIEAQRDYAFAVLVKKI